MGADHVTFDRLYGRSRGYISGIMAAHTVGDNQEIDFRINGKRIFIPLPFSANIAFALRLNHEPFYIISTGSPSSKNKDQGTKRKG
jgi:hypothetical protein